MGPKRVMWVRRYQGQCRALRPLGHQGYRLRSHNKDQPLCSGYMVVAVGGLGAWWAWLGAGARVDVYLVGSLCCLMVRGWCMLCVDGAGVGAWGWVLDVGALPARCGRA